MVVKESSRVHQELSLFVWLVNSDARAHIQIYTMVSKTVHGDNKPLVGGI